VPKVGGDQGGHRQGRAGEPVNIGHERQDRADAALEGTGYKQEDYDDIIAALQEHEYSVDHNVTERKSIEERMERYREATFRTIMLAYQLPDFGYVVEQLEILGKKYEVDNNAMTILRLIEEQTGVKGPAS
jgi:hypothetical protein